MKVLLYILLIIIFVTGHVFGYILFYKEDSKYNKGIFINIFTTVYPSILVLTFLAWILSNRYSSIRLAYLIGLNFTYVVSSILSALASSVILQKVENKINSSKIGITYILRLLIIGYGAFCVLSSISVTKSTLYLINLTDYEFIGSEIKKRVETNAEANTDKTIDDIQKLSYFLDDVKQIDNDTLRIFRKNIFSFLTGNYLINLGENSKFKLEYYYLPARRDSPLEVHKVTYKPSNKSHECFVNISTIGGRKSVIETKELIQKINRQLLEYNSIKSQIKKKPAGLLDFAFSTLMDSLGFKNYNYESKGKTSENVDLILKWLFWIFTSIIIFEFSRNWKKKN